MTEAVRVGRDQRPLHAGEQAICDDVGNAIGHLMQERAELQDMRDQLDDAYFEQLNRNTVAANNGAPVSDWQTIAMEFMRLKREEMSGRLEDQNVALYVLARAGLGFCPQPNLTPTP